MEQNIIGTTIAALRREKGLTQDALAAQPAVIIARLLVFLAPIMQPKNAATAAQTSTAPFAISSLIAPRSISADASIKSTSSVPQHTSVPSAHFFAYHAVFTVFSTQKPPLHSPT